MPSADLNANCSYLSVSLANDLVASGFGSVARLTVDGSGARVIVWLYSYEYEISDAGRSRKDRQRILAFAQNDPSAYVNQLVRKALESGKSDDRPRLDFIHYTA
jgi:hypothetical protein